MIQRHYLLFLFLLHFTSSYIITNKIINDIRDIINITITNDTRKHSKILSQSCRDTLSKTLDPNDDSFLIKLYRDLSPMYGDVSSYTFCYNNVYLSNDGKNTTGAITNYDTLTYMIFKYKYFPSSNSDQSSITYNSFYKALGVCVPRGCSVEEYNNILFDLNDTYHIINNVDLSVTSFIDLGEKIEPKYLILKLIIPVISLLLLMCQFLLAIPKKMFSLCIKRGRKTVNKFVSCFSMPQNIKEVFGMEKESSIYNDNGISFIAGFRGIIMILLVFGLVFKNIYINPLQMYSKNNFEYLLNNSFFSFLFFIMKFSYKMLYSLSGFCLSYKFLFYLENESERKNDNEEEKEEDNNQVDLLIQNDLNDLSEQNPVTLLLTPQKHNITIKHYFYFIGRQVYKYIFFVCVLLFIIFFYMDVVVPKIREGQFINYLRGVFLSEWNTKIILSTIFLIPSTCSYFELYYNHFTPIANEMLFFILGALLIYYCFTRNKRLDIILIIIIIIGVALKITAFNIVWFMNKDNRFYPAKDYMQSDYSYLRSSSYFNISYYCIGMFFGIGNFTLQKTGMDYKMKNFMILPHTIINFFREGSCPLIKRGLSFIIAFLVLIFIAFFYNFTLLFNMNNLSKVFFGTYWVNMFNLFNSEVALICFYSCILTAFYFEDSFLSRGLTKGFFRFVSKSYFSFIMMSSFFVNSFFFVSESRVPERVFFLLYLCSVCFCSTFLFSLVIVIFFEIPMKKINQFIIHEMEDKSLKNIKRDIDSELSQGSELISK